MTTPMTAAWSGGKSCAPKHPQSAGKKTNLWDIVEGRERENMIDSSKGERGERGFTALRNPFCLVGT